MRRARAASNMVETLIREYPAGCHLEEKSQTAIDAILAARQNVLKKMLGSAHMLQENLNIRYKHTNLSCLTKLIYNYYSPGQPMLKFNVSACSWTPATTLPWNCCRCITSEGTQRLEAAKSFWALPAWTTACWGWTTDASASWSPCLHYTISSETVQEGGGDQPNL